MPPNDQVTPPVPPPGGANSPQAPQPSDAATQALTIDGATYTPDQVKELLKTKTDYSQLQSEFTKRSQFLSDPEKLLEYARSKFPDKFPTAPAAPLSPDEQGLAEAEKILRSRGFLTKDEAIKLAQEQMRTELDQRDADQFIRAESEKLSKEFDGSNGAPKFVKEDVAKYALEKGFPNLTSAFRDMHFDALREWFASQKPKPKAPVIAGPGGGGSAPVGKDKKIRLDDDSFGEAFDKFMEGAE